MKLRSGKQYFNSMPQELRTELINRLSDFRGFFGDDPQHAANLLEIIKQVKDWYHGYHIQSDLKEYYGGKYQEIGNIALGVAARLMAFIMEHPEYRCPTINAINEFEMTTNLQGVTQITEINDAT